MADTPGSSDSNNQGFKGMLIKGVIGAVSLAGTTAIPLLVQQHLGPSPTSSPSASPSAQAAPPQVTPAQIVSPTQVQPIGQDQNYPVNYQNEDNHGGKKGKKKKD